MAVTTKTWLRRPKEPNQWYDRFFQYYLTTPATRRSVDAAWRQATGKSSKNQQASGAWYRAAKRWDWQVRAEAYDEEGRRVQLKAIEQEKLEDRRRRIDVMKAARAKLVQALKELDPKDATWAQVVHGTVAVNNELRKEYSDEPESRSPSSATPAAPDYRAVDLDKLTDDQLVAIERAAEIMEGVDS